MEKLLFGVKQPQNITNNTIQKGVETFSYFCQSIESDKKIDNGTIHNKLCYPDIHNHIFSFLNPKNLKNMSLINKATKNFIDGNIGRNFSIQLSDSGEIYKFITYLQDSNNGILLKNLKTLSLDIDLCERITDTVYNLESSMFNLLRSPFINASASEIPKFQQLIDQLKLAPIKDLHLKCRNISFDNIKYLANSALSSLTRLDLSMNNVGVSGVTELANGNLGLAVLVLNKKDEGAVVFLNLNSKTKLYLSSTDTDGNIYMGEVGEWKNGKQHGHGTFINANGNIYVGEWLDDKLHGHGTWTLADGSKHLVEYKNNNAWNGTFIYADGRTEEWENGVKKETIQ